MMLAVATLRNTIRVLEDFETQAELEQKLLLLELRRNLDAIKQFEQDASEMENVLKDLDYSVEDHEIALKRSVALKRAIKNRKELAEAQMEVLGLTQDKLELQRRLAALDD